MRTDQPVAAFAAVIVSGPGPEELSRLDDLLDSIRVYAPQIAPVLVLNDGNDPVAITAALHRHGLTGMAFANPRAGQGNYWMGRMIYGLVCAYSYLREKHPQHHILRLDSDALIIRPFLELLTQLLADRSDIGIVGSVGLRTPVHDARKINLPPVWETRVYRMSKPLSRWDQKPYFKSNLFGGAAAMRRLILQAAKNNYAWGYHANGGTYLLTAEANRRFAAVPALADPNVFARNWLIEDVFFSIVVHSVGLKILTQNSPGDIFASAWKGLMGETLDEVRARENAIVHSVKDYGPFKEATTRNYFRQQRAADLSPHS